MLNLPPAPPAPLLHAVSSNDGYQYPPSSAALALSNPAVSIIALVATGRTSGFSPTNLFWDFYINGSPVATVMNLQARNFVGMGQKTDGVTLGSLGGNTFFTGARSVTLPRGPRGE